MVHVLIERVKLRAVVSRRGIHLADEGGKYGNEYSVEDSTDEHGEHVAPELDLSDWLSDPNALQ